MQLNDFKVVPVVVLNDRTDAERQLSALVEGGLPVAEITFRTDYAAEGIRFCKKNFPGICVGAGTVVNASQCARAIADGAAFIVSPGFSRDIAELCLTKGVPYLPGCVTPTEIMAAMEFGIYKVKFFPANVYGGLEAIKALAAPFTKVKFVPTGGVNSQNLREFLSCDRIAAVGGSWMMKGDTVAECKRINEIISSIK